DLTIAAPLTNGGLIYNGMPSVFNSAVAVVTLSGVNTITQGLTVQAGTVNVPSGGTLGDPTNPLAVTATGTVNYQVTLATAQTVGDGATANSGTLGGTGTINRPVTVLNGGTIAPGSSPGKLGITGAVTMNAGATFAVEVNGTTPGTQYDQLDLTGGGTISL